MADGSPHPVVSVVLATYKRQHLLPRAIASIVAQSMTEWELLVVDDEPSSITHDVVTAANDPRIRYVRHDTNRGLCAARNTGIRESKGRYVTFLDDDDEFLPTKLERQSQVLDSAPDRVGVVACHEEIRNPDGNVTYRHITLDGDVHRTLLHNDMIGMQVMVRRSCFDVVGLFDERLRAHDDFDMTLRLSRAYHFRTVPEPLARVYREERTMSTAIEHRISAIETMMETHPELRRSAARARWERRLARHHGELGDRRSWARHMRASVVANPLSLSSWTAFVAGAVGGPRAHQGLARLRSRAARAMRARQSRP